MLLIGLAHRHIPPSALGIGAPERIIALRGARHLAGRHRDKAECAVAGMCGISRPREVPRAVA
jgi:hypothetical protein